MQATLLSALFADLVAILVTVAIERWGWLDRRHPRDAPHDHRAGDDRYDGGGWRGESGDQSRYVHRNKVAAEKDS